MKNCVRFMDIIRDLYQLDNAKMFIILNIEFAVKF